MTFIVGFHCADGLVMCADSKEGDGITKVDAEKIWRYCVSDEWGVAIGGSGPAGIIEKLCDKLKDLLGNDSYNLPHIEATIERCIEHMQDMHDKPKESFQLLVGVFSRPDWEHRLYRSEGHCLRPFRIDAACTGMDVTLARFLLCSLHDVLMLVDEAVRLGILITSLMTKHADRVEGPLQVTTYRRGDSEWKRWGIDEIEKVENEVGVSEIYELLRRHWRKRHPEFYKKLLPRPDRK